MSHIESQQSRDADKAREFVNSAFHVGSELYRAIGPDRLLAAAQVYATLSTRKP